jgi:SNF2 family DNA or RNA helicase
MGDKEFVIVITQHRFLGNIFLPYLIQKEEKFFSTVKLVKPYDLKDPEFNFMPYEKELVELIDKYSDERLMKRFSRAANVTEFYSGLETSRIQKQILPYLEQCISEVAHILMLSPVRLINKEVKYANLYDEDEIKVLPFFARPVFHFERTPDETRYQLKVFLNDKEIQLLNKKITVVTNSPSVLIYQNQLIVFEKLDSKKLIPFFSKEYVSVPQAMEEKYYLGFVRKTIRDFEVIASGFHIHEGSAEKAAVLTLEYNLKYEACLVLRYRYGDELFLPNAVREVAVHYKKTGEELLFRKITRDKKWETSIQEFLKSAGLTERDGFYLPAHLNKGLQEDSIYELINWVNRNQKLLEKEDIIFEQGVLEKKYFTGEQNLTVKAETRGDWFDVYATVTFGQYSFPFIKLKNHILNGVREFELPNNEIAIIPEEWFARYKNILPFARSKADKMQFDRHHFALLQGIFQSGEDSFSDLIQKLSGNNGSISLPKELKAELRSYQKIGVKWMYELYKNRFGGCLADDMGLGKTLQTIALLLKLKRPETVPYPLYSKGTRGQLDLFDSSVNEQKKQPASLIVVPTSLIHNWNAEIQKFTSSLKVYRHAGQQRKTEKDLEEAVIFYDIILTTYGIVRNDAELLSTQKFFYLILDESQYVKNPSSKTYMAIMKLQSEYRLALTGTPIENSLSDLWSQMNFLNKGILGNLNFFRRFFITPIEKYDNTDQQEKLQVLIKPFVLRRTKDEVAKDLPPVMEQIIMCDMDEQQMRIYETEKSIIRNSILSGIEQNGVKNSSILILQGLTRLRQLANHPKMIEDLEEAESGKFEEIFRMLENVVAEKHKVLVFSSFVKHLDLLKQQINERGWNHSMLTGKTTNREEIIRQFQDDDENRIFLISLKAGGVGLNLTSADYVFIIDPWWNPASENQAISRAHRIGQNKHVFVYRFITQGSIEERIQQLQSRKSLLADKFINSNNPLQEISKEEIMSLFG